MDVEIYRNCRVVKRSKNLRAIIDYARDHAEVEAIHCHAFDWRAHGYEVEFMFTNGAHCSVQWADWRVLCDWIAARRSWSPGYIRYAGMPEFTEGMAERLA